MKKQGKIWQNLHTVDISSTTYLPRRVNVVCERPLTLHSKLLHLVLDVSQRGLDKISKAKNNEA